MVGQEGESEGTELKRPALLWFAAYILALPISALGIGSLTGLTIASCLLLSFFEVCHVLFPFFLSLIISKFTVPSSRYIPVSVRSQGSNWELQFFDHMSLLHGYPLVLCGGSPCVRVFLLQLPPVPSGSGAKVMHLETSSEQRAGV